MADEKDGRLDPEEAIKEENRFSFNLKDVTGKTLEGVYDYGNVTKRDRQVVSEVISFLQQRPGVPVSMLETELKQKFKIVDIPEQDIKKSLWYQITKDFPRDITGHVQGHKQIKTENGPLRVPHLAFSCDLDELDELINHILKKAKDMNIG